MLELNQVGTYTFYVEGQMNNKWVNVRVVTTKKGNLTSMKGEGMNEFKPQIISFLHENKLINNDVLSLYKKE